MKAPALLKPSPTLVRGAAAAAAAVVTTASVLMTAPFASASATPSPVTTTFDYAGGYQAFVVPADVWRVNVVVTGAGGGDSIKYGCQYGHGGAGGVVRGSFAVTPGSSISLFTGEGGHTTGASGKGSPDGSVHGGTGGAADDSRAVKVIGFGSLNGGGGGGSSSVWWNHGGLSDLMMVAGGGGGAGGTGDYNNGASLCGGDGSAGGHPAQRGYKGTADSSDGVQRTGGNGGFPGTAPSFSGLPGEDAEPGSSAGGGGGGGAGWNGSTGGFSTTWTERDGGGGGAGGTSATAPSVTNVSYDSSGGSGSAGSVQISYLPTTRTSVSSVGVAVPGSHHVAIATAVVAGTDGGGTVAFSQVVAGESVPIASCAQQPLVADGSAFTATCRVPSDTIQGPEIDAYYSGDDTYGPSQGTSTINWVGLATTSTTLTTSINSPTIVGDPVVLTAQTGYFDGNGTTTFFQDGVNIEGCTDKSLTGVGGLSYAATCELDGIPTGHHTFTATYAGDDFYGGSSASMPFTVNDAGTPLHILGTLPDTAYVGVPYDFQLVPTGVATPTVIITGGALPAGLTLDPDGRIYGTPTTAGLAQFDLTAVNGSASPATVSYSINVLQAPGLSGDAPDSTGVGQAYHYQYALTGQPFPTVSLWTGALPPGLTLSGDGLLSGTPTATGSYPFTLRAVGAGGSTLLDDSITVAGPVQTAPTIVGTIPGTVALGTATRCVPARRDAAADRAGDRRRTAARSQPERHGRVLRDADRVGHVRLHGHCQQRHRPGGHPQRDHRGDRHCAGCLRKADDRRAR